jgi:hypothetical protein
MWLRGALALASLGFIFASGAACRATRPAPPAAAVSRDLDALTRTLKLPCRPLEVWWDERPLGERGGLGPTDYRLVAVLRFERAPLQQLIERLPPLPPTPAGAPSLARQSWMPSAVGVTIRGERFDAASLVGPHYSTGVLVVVDGGEYVIISAQTS